MRRLPTVASHKTPPALSGGIAPRAHDRQTLQSLLTQRNQQPEQRAQIDDAITQAFVRPVAMLVLDMCGFSRITASHGIIHFLALIHRMEHAAATEQIAKADLKPGDLVFFNTMRRAFSHVGIYMGDGKFIHFPRTGTTVRVESMNIAYWEKRFDGARRVEISEEARTALLNQVNLDGADAQDLIGKMMTKAGMRIN